MTPPTLFPDDPPELDIDTARYPDEPGEPTVAELERCGFCGVRECRHIRCWVVLHYARTGT
jgi:hypothetical protein